MIHGAIDGFSRAVIYLKCEDNNRAPTVLELFCEGVSRFGLPDCVRSDHGGENVGVWRYMLLTHSMDYSCVLTGSSVHNESTFADTFRSLESDGILDPLNEVDLYCLHHIFLPRINNCVMEFMES